MSEQVGITMNNYTIALALIGCKRSRKWNTALGMMRELRDDNGLPLNVVVYNSVSRSVSRRVEPAAYNGKSLKTYGVSTLWSCGPTGHDGMQRRGAVARMPAAAQGDEGARH
eukprot:26020-Eustigmatos_ZCMA.PRE.1